MKVYNNVMAWNGTARDHPVDGAERGGHQEQHHLPERPLRGALLRCAWQRRGLGPQSELRQWQGQLQLHRWRIGLLLHPGDDHLGRPALRQNTSAGFDAHLGSGSPCIGAGVNLSSAFTTDMTARRGRPAARGTWALMSVRAANTAPTISSIANQNHHCGQFDRPAGVYGGDAQTSASSLTVSGSSSNPTLVPNANIVFGGSGASRTVTVTPASGQTGTATHHADSERWFLEQPAPVSP